MEWACLWNSRMQLHTLASRFQILLLQVDDLFVLQELISQLLPDQRTWTKFHLFLELVDTFFCVRTLRQVSLHFLGSEMNFFLWTSDKLVIGRHLLSLSCKYSGEASKFRIRSSPKSDSGGGVAMLSAESSVDVNLGLWKKSVWPKRSVIFREILGLITCRRMRFSQRTEKHIQWMICAR